MKLFNYDGKHDRVNGQLDLGDLLPQEVELIEQVIKFMAEQNMTDRYKQLKLAKGFVETCEPGEDPQIEFIH